MKKFDFKFANIGKLLSKEEMKNVRGGYGMSSGSCTGLPCCIGSDDGTCQSYNGACGCRTPSQFFNTNHCQKH